MRIAMIGPFALAPKGTVRMRALPLARELAARGHAVLIAMPLLDAPQEAGRRWEEDGVTLEYVALKPWVRALGHLLVAVRLVAAALRWQPDVVHCFKPKGHSGLAGWALWRLQRLRLYRGRLIVDEDDWEGLGGWNDREPSAVRRRLFAWQERWGLRRCDAITVASRALETLVWSLGVRPERVCYLPNGFVPRRVGDRQAVRAAHAFGDRPVVLLYTRFFEFDVGRVVHVFARIGQALPEVRF
ncbi:MAG: glycosyltransferase family 4 protein, partial [Chloroflexi bacterium]|nr:glycosyltransferase family 4 protein [Chloroflexota bacterium]